MSHPEDSVGALMDFELVSVREDVTLEVVLRYLRRFEFAGSHRQALRGRPRRCLRGVLPVNLLAGQRPRGRRSAVMVTDAVRLHPEDKAEDAAGAFERYDLISAPVVTSDNRLMGRVTVADVVDYIREESEAELLSQAGPEGRGKTSCAGVRFGEEPLGMAGHQSGHRLRRLACHRPVRGSIENSWRWPR